MDEFFEKIESKVLEDMDRHRFSPLFMETFIRLKIPVSSIVRTWHIELLNGKFASQENYKIQWFNKNFLEQWKFILSGKIRSYNVITFQYTGKSVIPKGSKIRVVKPGSGPPFLTPREFEKKFGVKPKVYTDEELTRIYDSVGRQFYTVSYELHCIYSCTQSIIFV